MGRQNQLPYLLVAALAVPGLSMAAYGLWGGPTTPEAAAPAPSTSTTPSTTPSGPTMPQGGGMVTPGEVDLVRAAPVATDAPSSEALCPGCDVVVITICSLRRDHVSAYGEVDSLTPNIDRIAAEGVRFDRAYSASNFTLASLTAILTGRFGSSTGVLGWDKGLVDDVPTLSSVLGLYGYHTGAFTIDAASGFRPDYGLDRGFQTMRVISPPPDTPDGRRENATVGPGGASAAPVAEWIRAADPDVPLFTMFHSRTAHYPFVINDDGVEEDATGVTRALWLAGRERTADGPMPGSAGGTAQKGVVQIAKDPVQEAVRAAGAEGVEVWKRLYADAVARMDQDVGVVLKALEDSGRLDRTVVLLVADHGESLDDHGELLHGDAYFDGVVRVPLVMRIPGVEGGQTVAALVSQVDIAPTLLRLVGAMPPAGIDGRSAVPLLTGELDAIRGTALVEGGVAMRDHPTARGAVISPPWVMIRQDRGCSNRPRPAFGEPQTCLFSLDDTDQLKDLAQEQDAIVTELSERWSAYVGAQAEAGEALELDPDFVEMLQQSGYDFRP